MTGVLVLGAAYLGAVTAQWALDAVEAVTLADDWSVTARRQVAGLEAGDAAVRTVDIRDRAGVQALLQEVRPDRVLLLACQASRPIADRSPTAPRRSTSWGCGGLPRRSLRSAAYRGCSRRR